MHGAQTAALVNGHQFASSLATRYVSGTALRLILEKDFLCKIDGGFHAESGLGKGATNKYNISIYFFYAC
jgi:hypothetical protein